MDMAFSDLYLGPACKISTFYPYIPEMIVEFLGINPVSPPKGASNSNYPRK
jgi:hypothetical protein